MSFRFKKKESISKAVHRLTAGRIEDAQGCLEHCDQAEAIHCARKDIKKVRAVLRLARTRIRKKDFRRLMALLRKIANDLAAPRDAHVTAATLGKLMRHFKGQLAPGAVRHVRAGLRQASKEQLRLFAKSKRVRSVTRTLRRTAKTLKQLKVRGDGWKAICPGVKTAYDEGQRACRAVKKDPSPEGLHEWRKAAKDLWYQVTLLQPLWPEQMEAMASELQALGEYLGDDHDLTVLRQTVEARFVQNGNPRELEILKSLNHQRQQQLRARAWAIGARFYAENPSAFCDRLAGYWRIWRGEKKASLEATQTLKPLRDSGK